MKVIKSFCQALIHHPDIVTCIRDDSSNPQHKAILPDPVDNMNKARYALSIRRTAATPAGLPKARWQVITGIPGWPKEPGWVNWKCKAVASAEPLEIYVAGRSWKRGLDLEKLVEDVAVTAGMTKGFAEQDVQDN